MRVLFQKFHCPSFICFCKPSPHLLSPSPLKLENSPHVPSTLSSVPKGVFQPSDETIEKILDEKQQQVDNFPKSILKRPSSEPGTPKVVVVEKGRVQWMDLLGKELVEIQEFEPSESGDSDDEGEGNRGCVCVIQ